jgi:integrase
MSAWIEPRNGKYLVRWRELGGQKHSKVVRTKAEARALKAEVENQMHRGTYTPASSRKQAFGDYVTELLESELSLEASTLYNHVKAFEKWVEPGLGNTPIGEIDSAAIRRFFGWMQREGASDATVARMRAQLTKYFRRAVQEGILARNPVAAVPAPRTRRREIRVMTPEEVQAVADAHPGPQRMIPLLSAWGTFRLGEVAALTEDCIEGDTITVKRSIGTAGSVVYLKSPKTASSRRTVQLPGWVMNELREHMLRYPHEGGFLFRNTRGELVSHQAYHTTWRKALKLAGFQARGQGLTTSATRRWP